MSRREGNKKMISRPLKAAASYPYYLQNLRHVEELAQNSSERGELVSWLLETAHCHGLSVRTSQLACVYLDLFTVKWRKTSSDIARVVAATCLMVASKFQEVAALTPDWVSDVCGHKASRDDVTTLELLLLSQLNYDLDQPTAAEVVRLTLCMAAPGHDFKTLIEESEAFSSVCYPNLKLMMYGSVTIGLAAVCCALEQRTLYDFRDQWLDLVLSKVTADRDTVKDLSHRIKGHLKDLYGSDAETECESPGLERTLSV